jgi:alkylation response protein AidB-like acyl-CoA dehydrogenase
MEFGLTEHQKDLIAEIREFCIKEIPIDYEPERLRGGGYGFAADAMTQAFWHQFHLKGVERGWPTAGWPKKYGGMGYTALEQGAINAEMSYWGARWGGGMSMGLVAPTVLASGTEKQKETWIPPIVRGEIVSFEAFTEPDAGSDEANMQMKAVKDGDFYVLNGQKTFISGGQKPDWLYTLARTADTVPKHRGLTMFMVDANSPGLTYRPLPTMAGSMQNEIFYDNVRVPKENMLGEEGRGFYLAMTTFEFERAGGGGLEVKRAMEKAVDYYRHEMRNGQPLIKEPKVRKLLAMQAIHHHIEYLIDWYQAWRQSEREKAKTSSIKRYDVGPHFQKDWVPPTSRAVLSIFGGLYTQLRTKSKYTKNFGFAAQQFERMHSIHAAGSPEIRKTVLAERGLGLPRVPRRYDAMIYKAILNGEK